MITLLKKHSVLRHVASFRPFGTTFCPYVRPSVSLLISTYLEKRGTAFHETSCQRMLRKVWSCLYLQ